MSELTFQPIFPAGLILLVGGLALAACVWTIFKRRADAARWVLRSITVLLLTLLALGPATPITRPQTVVAGVDVFFVVDRTGSMAGEDWNGNSPRLDGVRHDINQVLELLPGMRYSIISFDSKSNRTLPLTSDGRAVRTWATNLRQEITAYSQGSAINRVTPILFDVLSTAAEQWPDNLRLVYFFSDGENTADPDPSAPAFSDIGPFINGGAVLGYGSEQGGHMREHTGGDAPGPSAPFIIDATTGAPAITRIDQAELNATAQQLGLPFFHRTAADSMQEVVGEIDFEFIEIAGGRKIVSHQTHLWFLAAPLVALFAVEAWHIGARFGKRGRL